METKQIIHTSLASANAEILALEMRVNHLHKGNTKNYTYVIKHPVLNKWAVRYSTSGEYWGIVSDYLNPNQLGKLEDITEDWKNTDI